MTVDAEHIRLRTRATHASVAVSAVLVVIKFAAWLATGSVGMLSSLVDSSLDVVASTVNLFAVRQAIEPPDREHRFGHGKAEPLAALGQAAFLSGGALLLVFEAVSRVVSPAPVMRASLGIVVIVVSILFDGALILYQRYVVARTSSLAIGADELHFRSDLVVNAGVLAALVIDENVYAPVLDTPVRRGDRNMDHLQCHPAAAQVAGSQADGDQRNAGPRIARASARIVEKAAPTRSPRSHDLENPHCRPDRLHPTSSRDGRRDEPAARASDFR